MAATRNRTTIKLIKIIRRSNRIHIRPMRRRGSIRLKSPGSNTIPRLKSTVKIEGDWREGIQELPMIIGP